MNELIILAAEEAPGTDGVAIVVLIAIVMLVMSGKGGGRGR